MKLTFHGGAGEIGGNKILLEDGDARVFLDMGAPFHYGEEYFADFLGPRDRFGLRDHFALGLMPRIDGLYSEEALEDTDLKHRDPEFTGVLITHVHMDHTNHLQWVDPKIPVHLGDGTKRILEAWETTASKMDLGERDYRRFRTGKTLKLDGVEAAPTHVDHSVPAAYAYLLHTSKGAVAYTGDLRRHGPKAQFTEEFFEGAAEERLHALVIEGTKVAPGLEGARVESEADVHHRATEIVGAAGKRLVLVTFYPRDVDRMRTFWEVARKTERTFVVSAKSAYLLLALQGDTHIEVPQVLRDDNVRVYFREMDKPKTWERDLEKTLKDRAVGAEWVRKHQATAILQIDFEHLTELIDVEPKPGSPFIHSKSEPFEEDDPNAEVLEHWLRRFDLRKEQAHASGHLTMRQIKEAIEQLRPKHVIPVHTEHPEMFKSFHDSVLIPEKHGTLEL